jgi:hypothetical protein
VTGAVCGVWIDELSDIEFRPDYDADRSPVPPRTPTFHFRKIALLTGVSTSALGIANGSADRR